MTPKEMQEERIELINEKIDNLARCITVILKKGDTAQVVNITAQIDKLRADRRKILNATLEGES